MANDSTTIRPFKLQAASGAAIEFIIRLLFWPCVEEGRASVAALLGRDPGDDGYNDPGQAGAPTNGAPRMPDGRHP